MFKSKTLRAFSLAVACTLTITAQAVADTPRTINVQAGDLTDALESLAKQCGVDVIYASSQLKGLKTEGVSGVLETRAAFQELLRGTQLVIKEQGGSVLITLPAKTPAEDPLPPSEKSPASSSSAEMDQTIQQEIVVTGSQIRGAQPSSPVVTITQEEMRQSGHANLGEVARALPQNFNGGQNPTINIGSSGNGNTTGSSALNLRGLGPDATLTLLNGARMPYDGINQATDVASIPVAAIERIEILLDGASAIYGSDAVAGVANIILKRDYEGVEVSARYGAATDGGLEQQQYTATGGTAWGSGSVLVTADLSQNDPVYARQRDYLSALPNQGVTIYPKFDQQSTVLSGHQRLGDIAELTLDAFYTDRDTQDISQTTVVLHNQRDALIWGVAPGARFELPGDWSLRLQGALGRNDHTNRLRGFALGTGAELPAASPITKFVNDAETLGAGVEGPLFGLPGGEARLSVGAGYRNTEFEQIAVVAGSTIVRGATRSHHGYAEINLPLLDQLTVNGALRYESYSNTFGDVTTPKIGAIWKALPGLAFKASWGKSFKAPTLTQQYLAQELSLWPGFFFPGLPADSSVLYAAGGSPNLDPERAEIFSAGFMLKPDFLPGFSAEVGVFDIDYTERVIQPITNILQATDPRYADFVTRSPSVAEQNALFAAQGLPVGSFSTNLTGQPYDPAAVSAIIYNSFTNATSDHVKGVDVAARFSMSLGSGQLTFGANASWIDRVRQLTSGFPEFDAAGSIFLPARFRGQFATQWSHAGLTLSANVNHISGVKNTNLAARPKGGSMTTLDLIADYRVVAGPLGELGLNVAAMNLLNDEPPLMHASQPFFPPWDSTNYSALGRIVSATVTKRF